MNGTVNQAGQKPQDLAPRLVDAERFRHDRQP
jgi:hypothetical protein